MAHIVDRVRIKNYKSCKDTEINLTSFTALVGYNNGGKSNILEAIKWLLRRSALGTTAFYDSTVPIVVSGGISGITNDLLDQLDPKHKQAITKYVHNSCLAIRRTQRKPDEAAKEIVFEVRNFAVNEGADGDWVSNPAGIDNAISVLFPEPIVIGAMEDAEEDVSKAKTTTTIGKLIAEVMQPIVQQHGVAIAQSLDVLKQKLDADGGNRAPELNQFDTEANKKLVDLFPGVSIKLHVPPPEIKAIFMSGTIKAYEDGNNIGRDITSLGHGAQRSVQMALVRHLADVRAQGNKGPTTTLLMIDEPELYLHPQAVEQVRVALKKLAAEGYQVLLSTHSPQLITAADVEHAVLIRKSKELGTYSRKRLQDAVKEAVVDAPSQLEALFSLSNSSQILFSEKVVLVEGKTEHRLLPLLFEKITGTTLGQDKLALIGQGGVGNTVKSLKVLAAMDLPSKAIVDLDYGLRGAVKDGFIATTDPDVVACKKVLSEMQANGQATLDNDGLPKRTTDRTASEVFAVLAAHKDALTPIERIHIKLLAHDIWIWRKGSIEVHLGLPGKSERIWAEFKNNLEKSSVEDIVADANGIKSLLEWIRK